MAKQGKAKRYRNFTFVWYPESIVDSDNEGCFIETFNLEPLRVFLCGLHVKGYFALHDLDVYKDGEYADNNNVGPDGVDYGEFTSCVKKAHCHVVLMFDSVKDLDSVLEMLLPLGIKYAEPVQSIKPMIRYLIHADNPEKHQYSEDDVVSFGGAKPYSEVIALSDDDSNVKLLMSVFAYIRESGIISFARLVDSLAMESRLAELKAVLAQSYAVMAYIKSVAWEREYNG